MKVFTELIARLVCVSGNGFIEAGELDDFLVALWQESNDKVQLSFFLPFFISQPNSSLLRRTKRRKKKPPIL